MNGLCRSALLVGVALAVACGDNAFEPSGGTEEFDWSGVIAPGLTLEIKGISGDIKAAATNSNEADVHAIKSGSRNDPADVTIEVVQHAGGITICAVYPDVPGQEPNVCRPGDDGHLSVRDNDVEVTFEVMVPEGVTLQGSNVSGNIDAIGMRSDVFAVTVSGNIDIVTTGIAEAAAVSGFVDVIIGVADPGQDLEFAAVSGSVTVQIPSNTNAFVRASTVSGSVTTEFPLGGTSRNRSGDVGQGGPQISLSAVSGNVRLRSGPAA